MKYKDFLQNNLKFIIIMFIIIVLGIVGITFAFKLGSTNPTNINVNTAALAVTITGDSEISSTGTMIPIEDAILDTYEEQIIEGTFIDDRVLIAKFTVSDVDTNPDNTIYDIALHDIVMDCELKTEDLKWRLFKDYDFVSEGSFSPKFDVSIIEGDRLVLTNIQEVLDSTTSTYTFIMWISESCPSDIDIAECTEELDQSIYLNKNFSATIKLELSTKTPKETRRIKGAELVCE